VSNNFINNIIPKYILWYMNTHTTLNIKTDKKLKAEAEKVSEELGVPLSTVINAFLKQFVRGEDITLSANQYRPTPYLESILEQAQKEYEAGDFVGPFKTGEDFVELLLRNCN
jgi:addiction module RelB/DinJ family antitoxin